MASDERTRARERRLAVDAALAGLSATALAQALQDGTPSIWVMAQGQGDLLLELVPLTDDELELVLARLADLLEGGSLCTDRSVRE